MRNMPPPPRSLLSLLILPGLLIPGALEAEVEYEKGNPRLAFAARELDRAIAEAGRVDLRVRLTVKADGASPESFRIRSTGDEVIEVIGSGAGGAMYGGLEIAELLRLGLPVEEVERRPFVAKRGIKMNIPWDARTPSYDDTGDSAQNNIETMWDFEFWKAYLDDLARYRYNVLSLWSTHPYPNLVKLEEYPEAINEDVYRAKKGIIQPDFNNKLQQLDTDADGVLEVEDGTIEFIKKMSIDEKIAHWKKVFEYAGDRGIEIYLFSWNVFTFGATGKHGITQDQTNPTTIDYMRKSVLEALRTYPQIAGIGVCSGENDRRELDATPQSTEHFIFKTYGRAIMDLKEEQPDREVRFIHRRHGSEPHWVLDAFKDYTGGELNSSIKYAVAHMYSSRRPQEWESRIVEDGWMDDFDVFLNLRNDDIFMHRWGSPEYVREFIRWMPHENSPGFYMGSDGHVWAREIVSKHPEIAGQLEIEKHWYRFRLWGQLAFNNELGDEYWERVLQHRYPGIDAALLRETWQAVSEVIPQLNRSVWASTDGDFAAEGCMQRTGFLTVDDYYFDRDPMKLNRIEGAPDPMCISVSEWADAQLAGEETRLEGITPLQVAENLDSYAQAADLALPKLRGQAEDSLELNETLLDIESMAHLGRYYADKMRGAAKLALFRAGNREDLKAHQEAVAHFEAAVDHWKAYAVVLDSHYDPSLTARTHFLDWNATLEEVEREVETVRREGDFPKLRFAELRDGDRFPVGADLEVDIRAGDKDGLEEVKVYLNGLKLNGGRVKGGFLWSASSEEELRGLEEGFYHVEAVAIDKTGVSSRKFVNLQVGDPGAGGRDKWMNEIHQVVLGEGDILKSTKEEEVKFDLPRLEGWIKFSSEGKIIFRDESADTIIFMAQSKTKPGRHHAVFKDGRLTTFTGWPEDEERHDIWTSKPAPPKFKGPFKLGVTRGKKVICFTEENGEPEIVWNYLPRYD